MFVQSITHIIVVIAEGTIGFVGVTFESAEDTTVEVCVELQETTNGRPLNVDGVFTIVTTGDSATGNPYTYTYRTIIVTAILLL